LHNAAAVTIRKIDNVEVDEIIGYHKRGAGDAVNQLG
jgi:hypothetical protein